MKMASLLTLILLLFSVNMVAFAVDSPDEVFYAHAKGIACHRPAELAKVLSEADPIAYINDWARLRCAGYCRGCAYVDRIALIVPSEINGVTDYRPHPYPGADFPIYNIKVAVDMTGGMVEVGVLLVSIYRRRASAALTLSHTKVRLTYSSNCWARILFYKEEGEFSGSVFAS